MSSLSDEGGSLQPDSNAAVILRHCLLSLSSEPSGVHGGKLVMPLGNHMKSSAWQSTSILNATWWVWPGKLLGQDGWPVHHVQDWVASREKRSDDECQGLCKLRWVLRCGPALECTVRETYTHNLLMCAWWMWTGSGQVADGWSAGHKHPCLSPVLVKLACTSLCCKWSDGMHPILFSLTNHKTVGKNSQFELRKKGCLCKTNHQRLVAHTNDF